jgi:hypothetical protein
MINPLGNVAGSKINRQKPVSFLHTITEQSENERKKATVLTITSKNT